MSLQDVVAADVHSTFLNLTDFAKKRTIIYDGEIYKDIPVVLSGMKEKERRVLTSDHAQGLFLVTDILHCAISDLGGKQPEKGTRISINYQEGGGGYFASFYVASSVEKMGMLRVELEAIGE